MEKAEFLQLTTRVAKLLDESIKEVSRRSGILNDSIEFEWGDNVTHVKIEPTNVSFLFNAFVGLGKKLKEKRN